MITLKGNILKSIEGPKFNERRPKMLNFSFVPFPALEVQEVLRPPLFQWSLLRLLHSHHRHHRRLHQPRPRQLRNNFTHDSPNFLCFHATYHHTRIIKSKCVASK